jgi:hypothetical protein
MVRVSHPPLIEDKVVPIDDCALHRRQKAALAAAAEAICDGRMRGQHCADEARIAVRTYLQHMHNSDD